MVIVITKARDTLTGLCVYQCLSWPVLALASGRLLLERCRLKVVSGEGGGTQVFVTRVILYSLTGRHQSILGSELQTFNINKGKKTI